MSFKLENFGAEVANAKSTIGGICYYRYFNETGDTLTNAGYFPATLGLEVGDRIRVIPETTTDADEIYIVTSVANRTVTVKQIDTDGAVDSVNGKTGAVVLDASDVGALPDTTPIPEAIQVNTMPTADAASEGVIVQFIGTTDANYTNGYFYKCVSDGQEPATYSWTQVNVQPAPSGLPDQTGNSGKFLTTDGTDASWAGGVLQNKNSTNTSMIVVSNNLSFNVTGSYVFTYWLANNSVGTDTVCIGGSYANVNYSTIVGSGAEAKNEGVAIGYNTKVGASSVQIGANSASTTSVQYTVGVGAKSEASAEYAVAVGYWAVARNQKSTAIGGGATVLADGATQIGYGTNSDANTFKVGNQNGNFEIMSADGTIPAARHAALPAADGTYVLKLVIASGVPTLQWVAE